MMDDCVDNLRRILLLVSKGRKCSVSQSRNDFEKMLRLKVPVPLRRLGVFC